MAREQYSKYYFNNPELWDAIRAKAIQKEISFIHKYFKKTRDIVTVLDVGCGSGDHMQALSKHGYKVTGIDINPTMIKYARKKYPLLRFKRADMKHTELHQKFDAIICLCTVFSYNTTNADISSALSHFNSLLRPKGILILDNINPIALIEQRGFRKKITELEPYARFNLKSVSEHRINNRDQILVEKRTLKDRGTGRIIQVDETDFRLFFPQELSYFLDQHGFERSIFMSDFNDQSRLKALDGWRLVSISKKR